MSVVQQRIGLLTGDIEWTLPFALAQQQAAEHRTGALSLVFTLIRSIAEARAISP